MLRDDESAAWDGFLSAEPKFAGEELTSNEEGPDPPDILCAAKSGKKIGIEITQWVEHDQVSSGKAREFLQNSFLKVIDSGRVPRPDRIGWVDLNLKAGRLKVADEANFRTELYELLKRENATPDPAPNDGPPRHVPAWLSPQGAPVDDFSEFPTLGKYLKDLWIFPRARLKSAHAGYEWIRFELAGGAYTPEWMVQAAIDRIRAKIQKYERANPRSKYGLKEFDLLCAYSDEALLHNTPTHGIDFGFPDLAAKVARALKDEIEVFDRIFLFHPHEKPQAFCVYPTFTSWMLARRLFKTFAQGFFATVEAKWIDSLGTIIAIVWFFLTKNASSWERFASFFWVFASLCAGHLINAAWKVWKQTRRPPAPASFSGWKLIAVLMVSLLSLSLLSFYVYRVEEASTRTFIYLAPTADLMECQKRAFFVKLVGPKALSNVELKLKDNKSGLNYTQTFPEIDPGPLRSDQYFWFMPSTPWDEDYTITATSKESHSSQDLIVRSTDHQIQFASRVKVEDEKSSALSCRDNLLPPSYALARNEKRSCAEAMKIPDEAVSSLDVYMAQHPDGSWTLRRLRSLPGPSELDEQSDQRHLSDYQKQLLRPVIKRFARSRLRVFYSGGPNTKAYAEEFRKLFAESWKTSDVFVVPVGDERIIDVQITVGEKAQELQARTLLDAFQSAGIKHRKFFSVDPDAGNTVVLWVGPRSPKDANPDQCGSPELHPKPGQPHNCDWLTQSAGVCPFVPQ